MINSSYQFGLKNCRPFNHRLSLVIISMQIYLPMQHVELFNYENFTLKTVENLFSSSRR